MKTTLNKLPFGIGILACVLMLLFSGCQKIEQPKTDSEYPSQSRTLLSETVLTTEGSEKANQANDILPDETGSTVTEDRDIRSYNSSIPDDVSNPTTSAQKESISPPAISGDNSTTANNVNISGGTITMLWPVPGIKTVTSDYYVDEDRKHPYMAALFISQNAVLSIFLVVWGVSAILGVKSNAVSLPILLYGCYGMANQIELSQDIGIVCAMQIAVITAVWFWGSSFYNVGDLQKIMGISRATAYELARSEDFPSIRVGSRIIIPTDLFNKWVEKSACENGR